MTFVAPLKLSLVALALTVALPACGAKQQKQRAWQRKRVQNCSPHYRVGDEPARYRNVDGLSRVCEDGK